jgi:hypothetical protein
MVLFSELNLNVFFGMKQPPKVEGDVPEGSVDHTHGIHHGLIDTTDVLKQNTIAQQVQNREQIPWINIQR